MKPKFSKADFPSNQLQKDDYLLEFNDDFTEDELNASNWLPFYLPQWSSREKSKPNYKIKNGNLILQITAEQKSWCPEFNGEIKCSSIQTGVFSGEPGSSIGQHKFNPKCLVREKQPTEKTYLPQYGYFEIRAKAPKTKSNVVALWMIGFEDSPEKSAEICIVEIKGENIKTNEATIGYGIHRFNDDKLFEAFYEEEFALDVSKFHIYSAEWTPEKVSFYIDNQLIREILQSPDYPMQFMLGIYELPIDKKEKDDLIYPKEFVVDYVRGYRKIKD